MNACRHLLLGLLLLASTCFTFAEACVKTVRWFDDAPYAYRGADGAIRGLNVDIARTVLQELGCQAKFVEMPWARALLELEYGGLDVLPGALRKPEREVFARFSRPINRSPNVLFVGKSASEKFAIKELSDVIGTDFRLGIQIDVSYGAAFNLLMGNPDFKARLTPLSLRRSAWKMLERNRLDGVLADETTGLLELQELGLADAVAKTRVFVSDEPALFAFSKKTIDPAFVSAFDTVFGAMLADGRYKEIAQRHLPCAVSVEKLGCR